MNPDARMVLERTTALLLDYLAIKDPPGRADIIWGLGSNEPRVAEKAAELFHQGLAPWVVFSGGNGHRWPDLSRTEGDLFHATAVRLGVPDSAIIVENRSTNTAENVTLTMPILKARSVDATIALLVTIPPFQRRAGLTVRTHRPDLVCINAPIDWGSIAGMDDENLAQVAELCVGEVTRLQDYPRRGFIAWDPAELPNEMIRAAAEAVHALHSVTRSP